MGIFVKNLLHCFDIKTLIQIICKNKKYVSKKKRIGTFCAESVWYVCEFLMVLISKPLVSFDMHQSLIDMTLKSTYVWICNSVPRKYYIWGINISIGRLYLKVKSFHFISLTRIISTLYTSSMFTHLVWYPKFYKLCISTYFDTVPLHMFYLHLYQKNDLCYMYDIFLLEGSSSTFFNLFILKINPFWY